MEAEKIRLHQSDSGVEAEDPNTPFGWWARYRAKLELEGLSEAALSAIDIDSQYIVERGLYGAGDIETTPSNWPQTRTRRGLVMGAVQSGKTASLIAVIAKSLDRKVDVVVVLGGTRTALWRQTYERIISQLDQWDEAGDSDRRLERILLPSPSIHHASGGFPDLQNLYFETPNLVRSMLIARRPLIAVVMKQVDHLEHFGRYLHKTLTSTFAKCDRPLHMLVIDDEADDGSVLDSESERGRAIDSDLLKQIPRHIQRLWSGGGVNSETLDKRLYASYLAYTATPQANFLQSDHNPLSPTDFIAALRVPLDSGTLAPPRDPTFTEPRGLRSYYTGGELFYRRLEGLKGAFSVTREFPEREPNESNEDYSVRVEEVRSKLLGDALRSYFVSGAVRLYLSRRSLSAARNAASDTEQSVRLRSPKPHSMLFHPSARIDTHFTAAQEIVDWTEECLSEVPAIAEVIADELNPIRLNVAGLLARLNKEEDAWKSWLTAFDETRHALSFFPRGNFTPEVNDTHWPEIKRLLQEEVFPYTKLTVINSDPRADDRPQFEPERVGKDLFAPARDIYTIFVSGNVMSRGITLEGLTTTIFLRSSDEPASDTQMQMQRWFGYRGSYLSLCRVFLFADQHRLFLSYHEADEALRREILGEMNANSTVAPKPTVLQGVDFRATGKIANLRALPLCPGADPFVRLVEFSGFADQNTAILADLLEAEKWNDVVVGGTLRGKAMRRQISLVGVAELLESFRYARHSPTSFGVNHARWRALEAQNNLDVPEAPLFRPPRSGVATAEIVNPQSCPYSIAAYLRLWAALVNRKARGIIPTDDRSTPWSMINLKEYAATVPKFFVGIRYGSAGKCSDPRLAAHGILRMDRAATPDGVLISTWGSRNPGQGEDAYLGDQLFDYHIHGQTPPIRIEGEPLWRRRGAPGLVLFHVIRGGDGQPDAVTVGLALPLGGPDHIAALRPGT